MARIDTLEMARQQKVATLAARLKAHRGGVHAARSAAKKLTLACLKAAINNAKIAPARAGLARRYADTPTLFEARP